MTYFLNKKSFLFVLLFCVSSALWAQTDRLLVELADELYEFGDYEDALEIYIQATLENPNNVRAHYMSGICYLRTTANKHLSVEYLLKAKELDPDVSNKLIFNIAEGYRFGDNFDKAISYYNQFLNELNTNRRMFMNDDIDMLVARTNRRIEECNNAKSYIDNPISIKIENIGAVINSEFEDYAPTISEDENILIFTSKRRGSTGGLKDVDNKFFEDIYISQKDGAGNWSAPKGIGENINSETHDSNIGLSPDGLRLYIYKTDNGGDIYISEFKKGVWQKPKSMGKLINSPHKETSITESADGDMLIFSSDRPGGKGGSDLYMSKKDKKGNWSNPTLLSDAINTEYDEESPYFDAHKNILYFSSKGHKGMGGFDIYKSEYNPDSDTWGKPVNLGYPINTSDDDLFFTLSSDGITGYYSSHKADSYGYNDIYKIYPIDEIDDQLANKTKKKEEKPKPEKEPEEEQEPIEAISVSPVKFKLYVYDSDTNIPLYANVQLTTKSNSDQIASTYTNKEGQFEFLFEDPKERGIVVTIDVQGYLFQSINLQLPEFNDEIQTIEKQIALKKPKEKVVNILRNIYFDFDQFSLKKESYTELNKLYDFLVDNKNVSIEIAGHTDFIGTQDYNLELSKKRSGAVYNYLTQKGIDKNRIKTVGYGASRPLASNDDESEGRELNRRTEFIILPKTN